MPFIPLECPFCGANLSINSDHDAAICNSCGRPFIVKDAIVQNYINNNITINADTLNVVSQKDFEIHGGVLIEYNGEAMDVVVPNTVIKISETAFSNTLVKSIVVPDGTETIAFERCDNLSSVKISSSVKTVQFSFCRKIIDVLIPNGASEVIVTSCSGLKEITLPSSVKTFNFKDCSSLVSVTLPDGITEIGKETFMGCSSLKSIVLPDSVKSINQSAFSGCSNLETISFSSNLTAIGNMAFVGCTRLKTVSLPNRLTIIGEGAFSGCESIETIKIPQGVHCIPKGAFYGCSKMKSIVFPDGLSTIGESAFFNCASLTRISFPNKTTVAEYAFNNCTNLAEIEGGCPDPVKVSRCYAGTKYANRMQQWMNSRLCSYCGGKFDFWNGKRCTKCGRDRAYLYPNEGYR